MSFFLCVPFQATCHHRFLRGTLIPLFDVLETFMHIPRLAAKVTPLLPTRTYYLPLCTIAVKAIPNYPTAGTPTLKGLRSCSDFLLERSPNMLAGPAPSTHSQGDQGDFGGICGTFPGIAGVDNLSSSVIVIMAPKRTTSKDTIESNTGEEVESTLV